MRRLAAAAATACGLAFGASALAAADPPAAALHALFERHWEETTRRFPEGATYRGDLRYNDRLTDESAEAIAAWDESGWDRASTCGVSTMP